MDSVTKQSDYPKKVFFLGAGATALAGVPTFANFGEKAEEICDEKLLDDESKKQFERILKYWKKNFNRCNIEEFYEAIEMRETLANPADKEKQETVTTGDIEEFIYSTIQKSIKIDFLFSWNKIPGNDSERLTNFLIKKYPNLDRVKTANIKKSDDGSTIYIGENFLSLILENGTYLKLKFEDASWCDGFIVKMENGTRNIYKWDNEVHGIYEGFLSVIDPSVIITTNWDTVLEMSLKKYSIENGGIIYGNYSDTFFSVMPVNTIE